MLSRIVSYHRSGKLSHCVAITKPRERLVALDVEADELINVFESKSYSYWQACVEYDLGEVTWVIV